MTWPLRRTPLLGLLIGALVLSILFGLSAGALHVPLATVLGAPFAGTEGPRDPALQVLWSIRAPRVALGLLVGASLGVSGALMQGLFRNPLASPTLVGVANGASLGAAIAIVGFGASPVLLPLLAFVGAVGATLVVLRLGSWGGVTDTASLLLAGIAVNAICGAGTGFFIYLSDEAQLRTLTFFTLGSLGGASWSQLPMVSGLALLPVVAMPFLARSLDAMMLGEAEASHLGVPVQRVKQVLVLLVCAGVGACVAASGVIGFVGLAVPHLVRLAGGPSHAVVLPGSALCGAALLVAADTLARVVVAPAELPIGLLTTLLGGPFFLALLLQARRR